MITALCIAGYTLVMMLVAYKLTLKANFESMSWMERNDHKGVIFIASTVWPISWVAILYFVIVKRANRVRLENMKRKKELDAAMDGVERFLES